jgi:hypothetical protein
VPPLPQNLRELQARIIDVDREMLQRVWSELDFRIDICRIVRGGHIEHLLGMYIFETLIIPVQ